MKHKNEVKIALVAILGIVVLFAGLQFLKGHSFTSNTTYLAQFEDISGLSTSSPVYANGMKVGVVEDVLYDFDHPDKIVAQLGLDPRVKLPQGTTAEIESDLMGNVKLVLQLGADMNLLMTPADTIKACVQQGLMAKAAGMLPQLEVMLPKLDSILSSVNTLLANPALAGSMENVEQITGTLTTTTQQLNQLTASLNKQVPQMMTKADGVLDNTQQLTKQLGDINVAATMQKVDATMKNVEETTAKLNSNEGTLGLLMRDPGLYHTMNNTMSSADSLLIDLKQHPKRYVHFSIFGKKDK